MGNHYAGSEGVIKVGGNVIAETRGWQLDTQSETTDDTVLRDAWRTKKPTLKSWTASITAFWDETDTNGQTVLVEGAEVALTLYPEGDAAGDKYFSGTAIVTKVGNKGEVGGMVEADFEFEGNGELTRPTVPA